MYFLVSRSAPNPRDDMLLVQTIQITDKFGFEKQRGGNRTGLDSETVFVESGSRPSVCMDAGALALAAAAFLLAQAAAAAAWALTRRRRRAAEKAAALPHGMPPQQPASRADSMCKLYDTGFRGAHHRHF